MDIASVSRWLYSVGLVDPRAGSITAVPHTFDGEVVDPMWAPDGRIVAIGRKYNFALWRYRPSSH